MSPSNKDKLDPRSTLEMPPVTAHKVSLPTPCLVWVAGGDVGRLFRLDFSSGPVVIGRDQESDIHFDCTEVSRRHAKIASRPGGIPRLEDLGSKNGTFVNGEPVTAHSLKHGDGIQIGSRVVLRFVYHDEQEMCLLEDLFNRATIDSLTGLTNRGHFGHVLDVEWSFATRHVLDLSICLFDVDHFKEINDEYGHPVGDRILKQFARHLERTARLEDLKVRYGGDEFLALLRNTNLQGALALANRFRDRIVASVFEADDHAIRITTSTGVIGINGKDLPELSQEAAIRFVDEKLYEAKHKGRNRIEGGQLVPEQGQPAMEKPPRACGLSRNED